MDVITEIPETTKTERAWLEKDVLCVDYHLFDKKMFYYIDAHYDIPVTQIVSYKMFYGTRKGFKKMELVFHAMSGERTFLKLSKTHEALVVSIYDLLASLRIKPKREIVKGGEK